MEQAADLEPRAAEFNPVLVVDAIRVRLVGIQACYEGLLSEDPAVMGKVTVEFSIDETGALIGATVIENTTKEAVAHCVLTGLNGIRIDPPPMGGPVEFSYPFVFAPQNP